MAQVSQLSPELARGVLQLATALNAAARNWSLYPPEHPAIEQSIGRLAEAAHHATTGAILALGVTPDTLLIEGAPADRSQTAIAETAALLHDRDILELTFIGIVPSDALRSFLKLLALEAGERRRLGGPAQIWAVEGHRSIAIEQVDYRRVLEREEPDTPDSAKRDDVWQSIVRSIAAAQAVTFDEREQQRLLAIAGSPTDIGALATAVMASKHTLDGSPMITSQAATVLAAYRHLSSIVSVMAPDRLPEVMNNLAAATAGLDPHVVMEVLRTEDEPGDQLQLVGGLTAAFDDMKVAQLLATALSLAGKASDRLATIFDTIAPDEDRKRRVLTLTRKLLSETDFGRSGQFQTLWRSMEELLVSYNETPYVSEAYRAALDGVGARAERLATADLPPELPEWMVSLGQENVRTLSVTLLIDLLALEQDTSRASDIVQDMEALAEDLLMAGAYGDAKTVTRVIAGRASAAAAIACDACRHALDRLGESSAMRDAVSFIGDLDESARTPLGDLIMLVGPASVEALKPLLIVEEDTPVSRVAADLIIGFGRLAVPRLEPLVSDTRWFVQRSAARLLGRIATPEAVPLLQGLLRRGDTRVAREAVAALSNIDDPAAARAIHTVLRASTGDLRRAVVDALVADRDARIVPMLVRIVNESHPLGKDHEIVLEALTAFGQIGSDQAIPTLARVIRRKAFFGRRKVRTLKERGVHALARIGTAKATGVLDDAARTGDRMLRKVVTARTGQKR